MKRHVILFVGLLCISCGSEMEFKGLFSYYNSTYKSCPSLFSHESILEKGCRNFNNNKVYVTNGKMMKECLAANQKAVVYVWSPLCQSTTCYRLEFLQQYLDKKGIELYIVSEYYDLESMAVKYKLRRPIFAVDTKYYKSGLTDKYMKRFKWDLTNKVDTTYNKIYYFENGIYINSFRRIEEIGKEESHVIKSSSM